MMIPETEKRIIDFKNRGFGLFVHYGPYIQYENGEWTMDTANHDSMQIN